MRVSPASIIGAVVLACSVIVTAGHYSGGDGSVGNPYRIADVNDFLDLSASPTDWSKHFILTADIIFDPNNPAHVFARAPIAPNENPNPLFQGTQFTGFFNGGGHAISNLTIPAPDNSFIGLFGYVGSDGQVKNVSIINANLKGYYYVGSLVGYTAGTINYCHSIASVNGSLAVGGLIGGSGNMQTITNCSSAGSVNGNQRVGGLVGNNSSATIVNSYSTCSVSGDESVGGLIGYNSGLPNQVNRVYSTGLVSGSSSVGGLVGWSSHYSSNGFWDTETSGQTTSAIGVGKTTAQMKDIEIFLEQQWFFVKGGRTIGDWLMLEDEYPMLACKIYPSVTIPSMKGLTEQQARVILQNVGVMVCQTYSVYDLSVPAGLVSETFPNAGSEVYAGLTPVHILLAKDTRYGGGDGVAEPFEIADLGNWVDMMNSPSDWNKSFILKTDINMDGQVFSQAPIAPDTSSNSGFQGTHFMGIFNGRGHALSNLTIMAPGKEYIGLFGFCSSAHVQNLGVQNAFIVGNDRTGGLVGYNTAYIINCYVTGRIHGSFDVGGLAGQNNYGGISGCYSTGAVRGEISGGLVGSQTGLISNSYSTCSVVSYSMGRAGGLVGHHHGYITNCYSAGPVNGLYSTSGLGGLTAQASGGSVTASFWDTETSGRPNSWGGTGKTTAQMQMLSTFTDAGWDFTNETVNGTANIWRMCLDGVAYPRLNWQSKSGDLLCPDGVGIEDLHYLANTWLSDSCTVTNNYCGGGDIDLSGDVGMGDLLILSRQWLKP